LNSFKLDNNVLYDGFHLKGYEIVFFDNKSTLLTFYDYKTKFVKKKSVYLNKIATKERVGASLENTRFASSKLFDLNNEFLVFIYENCIGKVLYVFSRADFGFLYKFDANLRTFCFVHEEMGFYLLKFKGNEIKIYSAAQDGFSKQDRAIKVKNERDLIRFLISKNYYACNAGDVCLKNIF